MSRGVIITGVSGGIGTALSAAFFEAGWRVVGTDVVDPGHSFFHGFLRADLCALASDEIAFEEFCTSVRSVLGTATCSVLVNNAATQVLGSTVSLSSSEFERSFRVNAIMPFLLTKQFSADLKSSKGTVLNIGSVHAKATKPGFVAYATSKAALHGLTRALAVDLGPHIRVLCLAPAAVATDMLKDGFQANPKGLQDLNSVHPAGRIAQPNEVARVALALIGDDFSFATGSTFWLDGGILSRLHDPA